jgi:hypothetical protein
MSANIIVKNCVLTALLVTVVTVVTGKNASRLECVDSLNMPAMLEYISNKNEGSYFDEKERAQTVLDQLHQKLDERLEARIKSYTEEYKQYMDESSDEHHPVKGERLPEVIKILRDSLYYWKKYIRREHSLIVEDNIGGTGAYYWANLWEIEQLVKELGGTIMSPSQTEEYAPKRDYGNAEPVDPAPAIADSKSITLSVNGGRVYVTVTQKNDGSRIYRGAIEVDSPLTLDKSGPVEIMFTRGEYLVIETGGQRFRPSTSGAAKITIE